jgi:hypothetical protein
VKDLKEEWTREELQTLFKEDWGSFGKTEEIRYGRYGHPLGEPFWNELKDNLNEASLKDINRILFALIIKRTDIRVFPTDELSMSAPTHYEFDRFQHSSVSPGSLIGIYCFSKDKRWAYVQTSFVRGWVRSTDLAIAKGKNEAVNPSTPRPKGQGLLRVDPERRFFTPSLKTGLGAAEWVNYDEAKERIVTTGSFINVYGDPSLQQVVFLSQMGNSFPILNPPCITERNDSYYLIKIPFRETDGQLTFRKGFIPRNGDVHFGFLPYTQENVGRQAFKMLHQPYGWGEMFGARDCSRFIMDLFNTFGILMPRNSKHQAMIGKSLGEIEGKEIKEKQKVLDQAVPLATLLRLPGHIMLYLGKENGRYYVIHQIWGIQRGGWFGPVLEKIGKAAVSDLSLGKSGPNGSLLHRLTDIRLIGSDP